MNTNIDVYCFNQGQPNLIIYRVRLSPAFKIDTLFKSRVYFIPEHSTHDTMFYQNMMSALFIEHDWFATAAEVAMTISRYSCRYSRPTHVYMKLRIDRRGKKCSWPGPKRHELPKTF